MPTAENLSSKKPAAASVAPVGIALLGCGVVGSSVARLLAEKGGTYAERLGRPLSLVGAAVRDVRRARDVDPALLTTDAAALATMPDVHIVVEVMGGVKPARELLLAAIRAGKHVVTANKEVLARHGAELFAAAREAGVGVYFEGAVAGGIPLVLPLLRSMAANSVQGVFGIVNGTTNYILTRMSEEGAPYAEVLAEAQRLGYAEADPASDVEGHDAAYKIAILAGLISGRRVPIEGVGREGITQIAPVDLKYARDLNYAVKLLAIARRGADGRLEVRVNPAMIPVQHPLASIRLVTNAVAVKGDAVGEVVFSGPGAGGMPTASAVVADILNAAEALGGPGPLVAPGGNGDADLLPDREVVSAFYLRLTADDKPGVLGALGTRFGTHGVSIRLFVQRVAAEGKAELVFVTHPVAEGAFRDAIAKISNHSAIQKVECIIRVEDDV
ncbi:MAG: homoserine dehydrogenase [Candidatus Sericytochromatia bacterium]|nr:homoserine dehydrogenase [Candidatus Tanganyikabacteria bacterium]